MVAGERPSRMSDDAETFIGGAWVELTTVRSCDGGGFGTCAHLLVSQKGGCPKGFYAVVKFIDSYGDVSESVRGRIQSLGTNEVAEMVVRSTKRLGQGSSARVDTAACIYS